MPRSAGNRTGGWPDDWVQVLTLWSMDPQYVDAHGKPRILRTRGPAPSVEDLVRRSGTTLALEEVCRKLVRTGAARNVKGGLAAEAHAPILFPPGSTEQSEYHLDLLHSVLLNIEHNAYPRTGARWVERQTISHNFPESALSAYSATTTRRAQTFLQREDARMHQIANRAPSAERTVRAKVHVLFSALPGRSSERVRGEAPPRGPAPAGAGTRWRGPRKSKR